MSWVRPDREILPQTIHTNPANAQLYDAVMVAVNQGPVAQRAESLSSE